MPLWGEGEIYRAKEARARARGCGGAGVLGEGGRWGLRHGKVCVMVEAGIFI